LIPSVFLAAVLDWKSRRIPNLLTAFIAIAGITYLAIEHSVTSIWWTVSELLIAIASTAIAGAILALIYICVNRGATHVPYAIAIATSTVATVFAA